MNIKSWQTLANKLSKSGGIKWSKYKDDIILPYDVADMDFEIDEELKKHLKQIIDLGYIGYSDIPKETNELVVNKLKNCYDWRIENDWIVWIPGGVTAIHIAINAFCNRNNFSFTFTPYYPQFFTGSHRNEVKMQTQNLNLINNKWEFDIESFEKKFSNNCKLLLLSNPQNPTGKIWTKKELESIGKICLKNNSLIFSDEVWSGIILNNQRKHIPIASLSPAISQQTITYMSESKTYNFAGLKCGYVIIPNPTLRKKFSNSRLKLNVTINKLGLEATIFALKNKKSDWTNFINSQLNTNKLIISNFCIQNQLNYIASEATYLAWIDLKKFKNQNVNKILLEYGVRLLDGVDFGMDGYYRFNFACPQALLEEGLKRLNLAIIFMNKI